MLNFNEFVVSLVKLTIPDKIQAKRVTLAVQLPQESMFIRQERMVKDGGINLFRQSIFLPQHPQKLSFKVYAVNDLGAKILLEELKVPSSQLEWVEERPIMLVTKQSGYELVWESWVFSEESLDQSFQTDRNYSELNLPFDNKEEPVSYIVLKKSLQSTEACQTPEIEDEQLKKTDVFGSLYLSQPQIL